MNGTEQHVFEHSTLTLYTANCVALVERVRTSSLVAVFYKSNNNSRTWLSCYFARLVEFL